MRQDWTGKQASWLGEQSVCILLLGESANNSCSLTSVWGLLLSSGRKVMRSKVQLHLHIKCLHILWKEDLGEWGACPASHGKNTGWVTNTLSGIFVYISMILLPWKNLYLDNLRLRDTAGVGTVTVISNLMYTSSLWMAALVNFMLPFLSPKIKLSIHIQYVKRWGHLCTVKWTTQRLIETF